MNGFENIYITHAHTHSRLQKTCIMRAHTHTHTHGSLLDLKLLGCSQITHKQTHKHTHTNKHAHTHAPSLSHKHTNTASLRTLNYWDGWTMAQMLPSKSPILISSLWRATGLRYISTSFRAYMYREMIVCLYVYKEMIVCLAMAWMHPCRWLVSSGFDLHSASCSHRCQCNGLCGGACERIPILRSQPM